MPLSDAYPIIIRLKQNKNRDVCDPQHYRGHVSLGGGLRVLTYVLRVAIKSTTDCFSSSLKKKMHFGSETQYKTKNNGGDAETEDEDATRTDKGLFNSD